MATPTPLWRAFAARAAKQPAAAALLVPPTSTDAETSAVSYAQLRSSSEAVAAALSAALPTQSLSGATVGLLADRSVAYVTACLGVSRTGAAWLPLDPAWSANYLSEVVAAARPVAVLLASSDHAVLLDAAARSRASHDTVWPVVVLLSAAPAVLSAPAQAVDVADADAASPKCTTAGPAYVLFTSGSTGKPKGVRGTCSGLLNRVQWAMRAMPLAREDVCVLRTSPCFVDAVAELFVPLLAGIPSLITPRDIDADPRCATAPARLSRALRPVRTRLATRPTLRHLNRALLAMLRQHAVTRLTAVPSLLAALLPALQPAATPPLRLRLVISSGEPLQASLWTALQAVLPLGARVVNLYGSTEVRTRAAEPAQPPPPQSTGTPRANRFRRGQVAGDVTFFDPTSSGWQPAPGQEATATVPIGVPIDGCWAVIRRCEDGLPVTEAGEIGELIVGGAGLCVPGYLLHAGDAQGTQRFVQLESGEWAHRTGDLASWSPRGWLVLHGRTDAQVKVRGQRVDLGAVEQLLAAHPAVAAAAARFWPGQAVPGDGVVTAYIELQADAAASPWHSTRLHLRSWLAQRLPPAAVPAVFVRVAAMPRTAAGKLDRCALLQPAPEPLPADDPAPLGALEAAAADAICDTFTAALPLAPQGDHRAGQCCARHFFDAGGTSLGAALLCARLGIGLQALLDHPTPTALAASGLVSPDALAAADRAGAGIFAGASLDGAQPSSSPHEAAPAPALASLPVALAADSATRSPSAPFQADVRFGAAIGGAGTLFGSPASCGGGGGAADASETAAITCLWRLHLGSCVDASPLLLLPPNGDSMWRVVVGSHANNVACVAFDAPGSGAGSVSLLWVTQLAGRVEAAASALPCGLHVAVADHSGSVHVLRVADGVCVAKHSLGGLIKAPPRPDPWGEGLWTGSHARRLVQLRFQPPETRAGDVLPPSKRARGDDGAHGSRSAFQGTLTEAWSVDVGGAISAAAAFHAASRVVVLPTLAAELVAVHCDRSEQPRVAWRAPLPAAGMAQPAVVQRVVVACAVDGSLSGFDVGDGTCRWRLRTAGPLYGSPVHLRGGAVVAQGTHDGRVMLVDAEMGTVRWQCKLRGRLVTAVAEDEVTRRLVVVSAAGEVHVLQRVDSEEYELAAAVTLPSDVFSSPVSHGGLMLMGCRDDNLYALHASA